MSKEFYIDSVYVKRKHVKSFLHLVVTRSCICISRPLSCECKSAIRLTWSGLHT